MAELKSKGRLPKWLKTQAEDEVKKHGPYLAFHYWAYNMALDGTDSTYDKRMLREIFRHKPATPRG